MSRPIPTDYTDYAVLRVVFETRRSVRVIVNLYSSVCRAPVCAHSFLAYCTVCSLLFCFVCARAIAGSLSVPRAARLRALQSAAELRQIQAHPATDHISAYARTIPECTTDCTTQLYYTIERECTVLILILILVQKCSACGERRSGCAPRR